MRNPLSIILVSSLFVAPVLTGACAPLEDLGGTAGDGGSGLTNADGGESNNGNDEGGPATTTGSASDATALIYVMSATDELFSFNPTIDQFTDLGASDCTGTPHSIAIDRSGNAYVLTYAGDKSTFYRLDLSSRHCSLTNNVSGEQNFVVFGMAFSSNGTGPDETLYLQGDADMGSASGLGTLDTNTFQLSVIQNTKPIYGGQLTGTGDGHLYGLFYPVSDMQSPSFGEIDKTTGNPISSSVQSELTPGDFEVAAWGGAFYFFTSQGYTSPQQTTVLRYSPTDGTTTNVATLQNTIILAAGVSTSAPR